MKGTIHWTAGNYTPSKYDKQHYHLGVAWKNSKAVPEKWHNYTDLLGHCWNRNTDNIGIAICAMAGATEYDFGKCPVREEQIIEACKCAAEISKLKKMKPADWKTHSEYAILDGYGPFSDDDEMRWDLALFHPVIRWDEAQAVADTKRNGNWIRQQIGYYMGLLKKVRDFHLKTI